MKLIKASFTMKEKKLSNKEWSSKLGTLEYKVTREGGTEPAFSHPGFNKDTKYFTCVCCDQILFHIDTKYDSGSGWPSFFAPISSTVILEKTDSSHGMNRTEVLCSNCEAHLGHVFNDGPKPTGLRYCINGVSLKTKASIV